MAVEKTGTSLVSPKVAGGSALILRPSEVVVVEGVGTTVVDEGEERVAELLETVEADSVVDC